MLGVAGHPFRCRKLRDIFFQRIHYAVTVLHAGAPENGPGETVVGVVAREVLFPEFGLFPAFRYGVSGGGYPGTRHLNPPVPAGGP